MARSKEPMTFAGLQAFARRVARQLTDAQVPTVTSPGGVTGWLVIGSRPTEENVISGASRNIEVQLFSDEVWLRRDGVLMRVELRRYSVGSNRSEEYTATELSESEARERDGRMEWARHVDRRPQGVVREEEYTYFKSPPPDRPPFLTISAALSRLRKGDGPVWDPTPQPGLVSAETSKAAPDGSAPEKGAKADVQPPRKNWLRRLLGL